MNWGTLRDQSANTPAVGGQALPVARLAVACTVRHRTENATADRWSILGDPTVHSDFVLANPSFNVNAVDQEWLKGPAGLATSGCQPAVWAG